MGDEKPLKILRIITRLNVGGPAQHVVFLTEGLNENGFRSGLVSGVVDQDEGDMSYLARERGINYRLVNALRNEVGLLGSLKALWELYRLVRREKPDIVHLHLLKARFLGGLAARAAGVPCVIETLHGDLFTDYYGTFKTQAILLAERILGYMVMDKVLAVSECVKENLLRFHVAPARKVEVIPLGLELSKFMEKNRERGRLRNELGIGEDTALVGIVGRMVPIKGHRYFLQAARQVLQAYPKAVFLLVGDGVLRNRLESECRLLGIEKSVLFLGWRNDVDKIYADLDVVAMSSLNEGTPVSLIEAMAAGRATVATKVGGVPDVIEDGITGILVPPKEPTAMAAAILRLLKDNILRRSMGERARLAVYPKYDVSRLIGDMENLYSKLRPRLVAAGSLI
jgi:glycosyltransferase involved in cell wall biosynthesis